MKNHLFISFLLTIILLVLSGDVYAQNKKKRKKINHVIAYAKGYINTPYVYGGNSKKGIDCSALIQKSYATIGIRLPRVAKDQAKIGNRKGESRIRPGDIVYFKFKQKGEKWWHSGLVSHVDAHNIKFIHASSSRGVVEDVYNNYYKKHTKFFRRVIK